MCAQFTIKVQAPELEKHFGTPFPDSEYPLHNRILPHQSAIVVTHKGFRKMNFSLIPSWSKEKRPKFATYNARLESIPEKPTWRKPFETKRCLIPITSFIEPIYENEHAGHMVGFSSPENPILMAAGIYDEWVDKETGEIIESFAIITSQPYEFILRNGHDRSPIFLKQHIQGEWLDPKPRNARDLIALLKHERTELNFNAEKDRPMRSGWQKRTGSAIPQAETAPSQLDMLQTQLPIWTSN